MQNPLKILYPDQCAVCGALVEGASGLCLSCWSRTPFIEGLICDACGIPMMGEPDGERALCDQCLESPPPWSRARAAFSYGEVGRRVVLGLKHGDRLDLVGPSANWMAAKGRDLRRPDCIMVPVPLHWSRLLKRRYNQSALLAREIARLWNVAVLLDGLVRTRRTRPQENMNEAERARNQSGAIRANPRQVARLRGHPVILVDDVLTSGATAKEATRSLQEAGVPDVSLLTLSRVVKEW